MTIDDLTAALAALPADAPAVFATDEGPIGEGYHVTELKLARIDSIDCGGRMDGWTEAMLQLLDGAGRTHMSVGKLQGILDQSRRRIEGLGDAPLRVEFAPGNDGLCIYGAPAVAMTGGRAVLRLMPDRAACKLAAEARRAGCCAPAASTCCA